MDTPAASTEAAARNPIDQLSREELLGKYKTLLVIAKKAKQAKDELADENKQLQEALASSESQRTSDKQALLDDFTKAKLRNQSGTDGETLTQLAIENEALKRQVDRLTKDNDDLLGEMDSMENQLKQVNLLGMEQKKHLELLEQEFFKLKEAKCHTAALQSCVSVAEEENKALKEAEKAARSELGELLEKHQRVKEINSEQRHKFNALKDRFVDVHRRLKKLKECKRILLETQHEYADAVSKWQSEIIDASSQLCTQMNALKGENEQLLRRLQREGGDSAMPAQLDVGSVLLQLEALERLSADAVDEHKWKSQQLKTLRHENESLQRRMDELSTAQRSGEATADNVRTAADVTAQLAICQQLYEELLVRHEQKEREHTDLLGEMRELNEALKARGDVISRQQERQQELVAELKAATARLQQIEESLNDKQRSLAAKDEQLSGIRREIEDTRVTVATLQGACASGEEQIRTLSEELQSIRQAGLGVAADAQSDVLSTSTISRAEESNRMRELDESFEDKYNKLRGLAVKLKKKLQEQTALMEEMERQRPAASDMSKQQELDECRQQLSGLQHDKEQSQKLIESLKGELQKLRSSRKQAANVLNLEIEAAEKSLGEASSKLAARVEELGTLTGVLASKEATIVQLRKEMALLEADKAAECQHAKQLKEQVDRLQDQLKDAMHGRQQAVLASQEREQAAQNLRLQLEEAGLQLSQAAGQQEAALATLLTEHATAERKLLASEAALDAAQRRLATVERTLEDLRGEHLDYKIKAQAVLRKNTAMNTKDSTHERELEEELAALRASDAVLQETASQQAQQLVERHQELDVLREEAALLLRRNQELMRVVDELRLQNEHVVQEHHAVLRGQQEALREHRQQIEQLKASHREQLRQVEGTQHAHVAKLQDELSRASTKAATTPWIGGGGSTTAEQQSKIDYLLMEREDAEGSEAAEAALSRAARSRKISSGSRRSQHDFMPLEELLNAPMNAINDAVIVTTFAGSGDGTEKQALNDLQTTRERLQVQESRVRHLTALLAENEQDLAKLTQQNDMLKEELRRQERSEEREKHMHNSEYLKNVVIKFLTLSSGDERQRLVPVLNTILKLSRTETDMLQCAAKGQKVPHEGAARSGGWTNFITGWGTSNNNN